MKSELNDSIECQQLSHHLVSHQSVQTYLQSLSGQQKQLNVIDVDHTYAKPWNRHPDSQIRAKAAKFLFMKNFPKHFLKKTSINESLNIIDIETTETKPTLSLLNSNSGEQSIKTTLNDNDINTNELPTPPKNGWTTQMNKLWTKAMKILHSDRLARLSYESLTNETILKRNLIERSANKFRHLFASAGWDLNLLSWLNNTLNEFVGHSFITAYHDSMAILRVKVFLIFYKLLNIIIFFSIYHFIDSITD
jgi:regulatory NSL complex subunit 3